MCGRRRAWGSGKQVHPMPQKNNGKRPIRHKTPKAEMTEYVQ